MEYKMLRPEELRVYIPDLIALHNDCFGSGVTEEYFEWRYLKNPMRDVFAYVALDGGKIASFYAVSPMMLTCGNTVIKGALSLNTMTSPAYRGRGLFPLLANRMMEHLRQYGYQIVIGFPNVHSNHIFNQRINFLTVYEVPMLELPLYEQKSENIQLIFDNLFELDYAVERSNHRIQVRKSSDYLRWRYADSPEAEYHTVVLHESGRVNAYAVCKIWRDRLNMAEFCGSTAALEEELLNSCIQYAKELGCGYLTVWAPINTERHYLFERRKFINRYPVHYFAVKTLGSIQSFPDVLDARNWELQMGDNNTY